MKTAGNLDSSDLRKGEKKMNYSDQIENSKYRLAETTTETDISYGA